MIFQFGERWGDRAGANHCLALLWNRAVLVVRLFLNIKGEDKKHWKMFKEGIVTLRDKPRGCNRCPVMQ